MSPENERWDELRVHPEWSFHGPGIPSWQQLYDAFERLVARHKKTTFIGVHFGNDPEDPDNVARMLDKYPNFFIDTAARVPEIGRHPQEKMRKLLRQVSGPRAVRHRHRHRRGRRRHDVRLDRRRACRRAPTRSASSRRPGATSRPPTASSRARRRSRAAGRSTASACPSRCCARSTSTTPRACCAGARRGPERQSYAFRSGDRRSRCACAS